MVTIKIPIELHRVLRFIARTEKVTIARVITKALEHYPPLKGYLDRSKENSDV